MQPSTTPWRPSCSGSVPTIDLTQERGVDFILRQRLITVGAVFAMGAVSAAIGLMATMAVH